MKIFDDLRKGFCSLKDDSEDRVDDAILACYNLVFDNKVSKKIGSAKNSVCDAGKNLDKRVCEKEGQIKESIEDRIDDDILAFYNLFDNGVEIVTSKVKKLKK